MKLVRWKRFTWDLTKLPPSENSLPTQYTVRPATREDQKRVREVIFAAFSLDTAWSDAFGLFKDLLHSQIDAAFQRESVPAVVVSHGQRIIAASALTTEPDAESHLLSGPCVLTEYRSRGIGSALLYHSLKQLQSGGPGRVHGICKETVPTSKFVYPKFGSTSVDYNFDLAMAGVRG
jgi:predicted N-acetyltransferase YhbS